jgi:hypothetical protein
VVAPPPPPASAAAGAATSSSAQEGASLAEGQVLPGDAQRAGVQTGQGAKTDLIRRHPSAKKIGLVDDEHIAEMKEIYQPRDVDRAVAKCKAWLKTPKGQGKAFTKGRLNTFLKDAEPLAPGQTPVNAAPPPPDRRSVDAAAFRAYVHQHYKGDAQRAWTPDTAPERVVRDFLNNNTNT